MTPSVPNATIERLRHLAHNLWWSWDQEATALFAGIDPFRWERNGHNPVALIGDLEPELLQQLASSTSFRTTLDRVWARFDAYNSDQSWADGAVPELVAQGGVAYFSMEFGLHESLRLYSGGLGVLAGDHLRSSSDLGVPLVGVSLLYRQGYFQQLIHHSHQLSAYATADWSRLPIAPCTGEDGHVVEITVPIEGVLVRARVWALAVGRSRLLLLDTDLPENNEVDRCITRQLYGGDEHLRIRQEVLLGLGGVAALEALQLEPVVYHLNEGHCAFVPLAVAARRMQAGDMSLDEALSTVRPQCVFTTHTPVPAGHDRFPAQLVERVLGPWWEGLGLELSALMDQGRVHPGSEEESLCMTVVALRNATASNGVSALHGETSRHMWSALWPRLEPKDAPIGHITNGVHPVFWMAPDARDLFDRYLPGWRDRVWDEALWAGVAQIPAEALWALRSRLRHRLVEHVRHTTDRQFDPHALTIGFARRFASYKRGNLLFDDLDRLSELLERGNVQVVFAGKAHPRDTHGQEILSEVVRHPESRRFRDRIVLLPDYDIALGALLTSGCDVWLNNPRRPHEASGTSGQKVCLNGGLNLSVLDGWWPEGFDGTNGFAIGDGSQLPDEAAQDRVDAESLYTVLEQQVLADWLDRDPAGIPRAWIQRIRRSVATCLPLFSSHRMVRDYTLEMYAPRCR